MSALRATPWMIRAEAASLFSSFLWKTAPCPCISVHVAFRVQSKRSSVTKALRRYDNSLPSQQMPDGFQRRVDQHARPCPPHHLPDLFPAGRRVAVDGAVLAVLFLFAERATVQAAAGIVRQLAVFLRHFTGLQLVAAIQLHHQAYGLFLAFDS